MSRRTGPTWAGWFLLFLLAALLLGCDKATDEAPLTPTPEPSATPGALAALDGLAFEISLDGEPVASEVLETRLADGALVVDSVVTWLGGADMVERRTVVLSPILHPTSYSYERRVRGVPSTWYLQRQGGQVEVLANNQAWFGPVLSDGLDAPGLVWDSSPSALPLVLAVLQFTEGKSAAQLLEPMQVPVLDVTADLLTLGSLRMELAGDQTSAVIGTMALEVKLTGPHPQDLTLWMRPDARLLFSAEFPSWSFDCWQRLRDPALPEGGHLRIERVREGRAAQQTIGPSGQVLRLGDDGSLQGRLLLPENPQGFPAMVLVQAWDQPGVLASAEAWAARGSAVLVLDPVGVGSSEGPFQRGPSAQAAQALRAAGRALAEMDGVDADRIALVAVGDVAYSAALALADPVASDVTADQPFTAAVLGAFATDGNPLVELASDRVLALAACHGWNQNQTVSYLQRSLYAWQGWLGSGDEYLSRLGRRVPLSPVADWERVDLAQTLSAANLPVLILHGDDDHWTPVDGAERLVERLATSGSQGLTLRTFPGLGNTLGQHGDYLWSDAVDSAVWEWLESLTRSN
ncbi:MAG: alpha/beta hydrolase family protein [Anaerolineae bacterium]|nr:alpha/beta hydrolase [Chloroflexota bacterium]